MSPKVYLRDSGLLHTLLRLDDYNETLSYPITGESWEGFVIESLIRAAPDRAGASYYRTSAGAEIDLLESIQVIKRIFQCKQPINWFLLVGIR